MADDVSINDDYESAMPDLKENEFEALKNSIAKHGIEYPILIDKNGDIIDGHHRHRAWTELEKEGDPPTIVVDTEDDIERALRPNLARRDFSSGQKREAVKRYLENHWEGERTQKEVAEDLGVAEATVSRVMEKISPERFSKSEKQTQVRNYLESNPNASNRKVAESIKADVSHATVGNWRNEWDSDDEPEDEPKESDVTETDTGMKAYAATSEDREAAAELFNEKDTDETAQEKVKDVASGKTAPTDAKKEFEREKRKRREKEAAEKSEKALQSEPEQKTDIDIERGDTIELGDHLLYCGDSSSDTFREMVPEVPFVFADPPYNAGAAEWDNDFQWQHDWLNDKADVVAVTPGIGSLFEFAELTEMPYEWSVACWIKNGRARGKMGYGNWVYVGLFSDDSIHRNSQDIVTVTIKESEKDESHHRGRKFPRLLTWLFERYADVGETVVDPFLGSGTTLLAAEEADRTCIGAEINPEFCEEIVSRWENTTDETARKV